VQPLSDTITPLKTRPTLELDELWSFVHDKNHQVWIWIAFERETDRIVGLAFGDRSSETRRSLWKSLPADYRKRALCYTDFWDAYGVVLPSKRHHAVGKETGETAHVERFNNTLRQRCANLVRKTLSFSKREDRHEMRIRGFVDVYNAPLEAKVRISQT
jgi:insertion element IS1 protein InsB